MPLGSVKEAAFGTCMVCSGGYLSSFGEGTLPAAGTTAAPRPRPAVTGAAVAPAACVPPRPAGGEAGFSILGAPDPEMPPSCADAVAVKRRTPRRILIARLRFCVAAAAAATPHR